jgi:serine/threonine-protein kinase
MNQDGLVGLVIDNKYRLDRKIGEGGMGAVYLATQLMVDRHVAIKVLHAGYNGHEKLKQRFEVEAKAIGRLHHPHCITLFDFGYSHELEAFYTVMEYLEGEALHKRLGKGVSPREALMIVRQIALGLDHAHHQGILHRDLKPENIMLAKMTDGSELVKVLDFGIARVFQGGSADSSQEMSNNRLTRAGEIFGTPAYISPEQARGERDLSPASDIYSLGVMLFELLEGRLPYWGESPIDTIMMHIRDPVPPITRLDVPAPVKALVNQLLSKDPAQRPQSGKRVAELIDQAVMGGAMAQVPVNMFVADKGLHSAMPAAALSEHARAELGLAPAATSAQADQRTMLDVRADLVDRDEWEDAAPTKISTPPQPFHHTMPPGAAPSARPIPMSALPMQGPPGRPIGGHGRVASSAGRPEPKLVALDYEAIRPPAHKRRWLFPAVILLLMLLAGGIAGVSYLNILAEEEAKAKQKADKLEAEAEAKQKADKLEAPPSTELAAEPPPEPPPVEKPAPAQDKPGPEDKPAGQQAKPPAESPKAKPKTKSSTKKNTPNDKDERPASIQLF